MARRQISEMVPGEIEELFGGRENVDWPEAFF
jgi:hypothetical protein